MNNGALFANNFSTYNESTCAVTAQWTRQDVVECYTGMSFEIFNYLEKNQNFLPFLIYGQISNW